MNEQEALFHRLLAKQQQRHTQVYMRYHLDGNPTKPDSLFNLLSLDTSMLTEDGRQILQYLETKQEAFLCLNFSSNSLVLICGRNWCHTAKQILYMFYVQNFSK